MVKVLNVAEKPSVAKEVSRILSNGRAQRRQSACAPCPSSRVYNDRFRRVCIAAYCSAHANLSARRGSRGPGILASSTVLLRWKQQQHCCSTGAAAQLPAGRNRAPVAAYCRHHLASSIVCSVPSSYVPILCI